MQLDSKEYPRLAFLEKGEYSFKYDDIIKNETREMGNEYPAAITLVIQIPMKVKVPSTSLHYILCPSTL